MTIWRVYDILVVHMNGVAEYLFFCQPLNSVDRKGQVMIIIFMIAVLVNVICITCPIPKDL